MGQMQRPEQSSKPVGTGSYVSVATTKPVQKQASKPSEHQHYTALERAHRAAQFEEPERWDGLS
jgi:hypothetical protein